VSDAQIWILALATAGSALGVLGLIWSGRQAIYKSPRDGYIYFNEGTKWQLVRGTIAGSAGFALLLASTVVGFVQ
jgi:hypothetical protein